MAWSPGSSVREDFDGSAVGVLNSKTYLQSLSPRQRNSLLKSAKFGSNGATRSRSSSFSRVAAASARRDELEGLLAQERERFIVEQSDRARQAVVEVNSMPEVDPNAVWEVARLRVRATSLAAENDALKSHTQQLLQQISILDSNSKVLQTEAQSRSLRMTEIAAARVAELEDQTERQRRALSELAVAAEELANDNVALSAEVLQLRDEKKGSREAMAALEDRVVNLQELYLRGLEAASLAPPASAREALQQRALDELATPEILAASRPPRDFPLPEGPPSTAIVPALHEIEALRRERDMLIAQVKALGERTAQLDTENGDLVQQCAAQKRAVHEASTLGQNRLVGAMRRIQYLVAKVAERDDTIKEKSKYIVRLETRLLAQHKTMQTAAVRNKPGTRAGSRSQQANWPAKSPFHPDNRGKAATADAAQENEQTEPGREQALQDALGEDIAETADTGSRPASRSDQAPTPELWPRQARVGAQGASQGAPTGSSRSHRPGQQHSQAGIAQRHQHAQHEHASATAMSNVGGRDEAAKPSTALLQQSVGSTTLGHQAPASPLRSKSSLAAQHSMPPQATTPGTVREVEAAARDEFAQHAQHTPQPPHLARHEVRPEGDGEQGRDAHLNIDQLEQRIDALNRTLTAKQASVSRLPAQTLGSTISEASFDDGDAGLLEWAQSVPTDDADGAAPHQGPGYSRSTPQPRAVSHPNQAAATAAALLSAASQKSAGQAGGGPSGSSPKRSPQRQSAAHKGRAGGPGASGQAGDWSHASALFDSDSESGSPRIGAEQAEVQSTPQRGIGRPGETGPEEGLPRPLTMLRSPMAVLGPRLQHLPPATAASLQELQARLSPVAASWNLYKSSHSSSAAATPPRNEAWQRDEQLAAAQRPAGSPHQSQASVSGSPVEDVAAAPPTQPQRLSERIKANHKVSMDEIEGFTQRLLTLHGKAGYQLAPRQNPHLRP